MYKLTFKIEVETGPLTVEALQQIDQEIVGVAEVLSRSNIFSLSTRAVWHVEITEEDLWDAAMTYSELHEALDATAPGTVTMPERPTIHGPGGWVEEARS